MTPPASTLPVLSLGGGGQPSRQETIELPAVGANGLDELVLVFEVRVELGEDRVTRGRRAHVTGSRVPTGSRRSSRQPDEIVRRCDS